MIKLNMNLKDMKEEETLEFYEIQIQPRCFITNKANIIMSKKYIKGERLLLF